jgi:WD40 repeat protein/tRNA A-37 threonylcarbamoyl transferase component Bud32
MTAPDPSQPLPDDPHQTMGDLPATAAEAGPRFRILRPHARGNLGEVFVAHDAELRREVALKEIVAARAHDDDSRRRFLVEAEVTGRLEHPGVVPVYSLGAHADGRPYYAMRFIHGRSLLEAIDELQENTRAGALDAEAASLQLRRLLRSIIVVCQAIDYAHTHGVIHRDLKPHNIMLGRHGETMVVDWGLAKVAGRDDADARATLVVESRLHLATQRASGLTAAGSLIGTPAYMSPEQASGRHELVGPASDIYSLGATLYHLLAGRSAFRGESVEQVLAKVMSGSYPPLRSIQPRVPRALEAIAATAMATVPSNRYATAAALADDIEHWLADQPFKAYRERPVEKMFRWMRRHRAWAMAGFTAVVTTALIALVAVRVVDTQRRLARQLADEKTTLAEAERSAREQAVAGIYRARAGELAASSRAIKHVRPGLGVLLAVEAIRMTTRHGLPIVAAAEESLREALMEIGGIPFRPPEPVVALSATGRWLIGRSQFFDLDAIEPSSSGVAHGVPAVLACSSDDESRLALMAADGSVTVIDPNDSLREAIVIPPGGESVEPDHVTLRLGPDGRWILIGSEAGGRLHDLRDPSHGDVAIRVAGRAATAVFSPDGRWLAMQADPGDGAGIVNVWRLDAPATDPVALAGAADHRPLAFSPDSREVLTRDGAGDSRVRLWKLDAPRDGEVIATVPGETMAIFPPGRDWLVLTERKELLKGWRFLSRRPDGGWNLEHVVEIESPEDSFAVACSDTWLVVAFNRAEICAWNLAEEFVSTTHSDLPDRTLRGHDSRASALAFSRDGRRLISLGRHSVQSWDFSVAHPEVINQTLAPRPGTLLARPDAPVGGATGERVMSPDGHWLAIDGEDPLVRILDLTVDDPMRYPIELIGHGGKAVFHAFSRDSRWLATGGADHTICIWDLAHVPRGNGVNRQAVKPVVRFSTEGLDPACLRFGAEPGQLWAAGPIAGGGTMVLWEWSPARPGSATRRAQIDGIAVLPRLAFRLSSDALTVALADGRVERHRLVKGIPAGSPERLAEGMAAVIPASAWTGRGTGPVATSPDGRWQTRVAPNSGIELVRIDPDRPEVTVRLPRDRDATFQCAAFSGDSKLLATGYSDGGLEVWNLTADDVARSRMALRGHVKPVEFIEFERSDRWLVSSSAVSIRLWEMDANKLIEMADQSNGRTLSQDERLQYGIDDTWPDIPVSAPGDR